MKNKILSLLARAASVLLNGTPAQGIMAEVVGKPDNQVVNLSWTDHEHDRCGTAITEAGLEAATFDAATQSFQFEDYEGDLMSLKLTSRDGEVLTPESEDVVFVVVQEGGSSAELYIHIHDSPGAAETDRVACMDEGSYRTSEVVEVPVSLADHPDFHTIAERLVRATTTIGFPRTEEN
jgi:hypothetical protein